MNNILDNQVFLLVFDLDGTLLTSEQTISPKTKGILQYLASLGNVITIASGRPPRSVKTYMDELDLKCPFICYNGTLIDNPYDGSFTPFRRWIPKEVVYDLLSHFGEDLFANMMIEDEFNQYYLKENKAYTYFFHPEDMNVHIGSIIDHLKGDVMTIVMEVKEEKSWKEIREYIDSKYEKLSVRVWLDAPRFGEFFFYDTNKATSIEWLANYYHIDRAHILAFGDAMNDAQMIQYAGVSFAMKNGAEELKRIAVQTTAFDHDHEGIYYALKDFFNI